jgi:hypothetical protein
LLFLKDYTITCNALLVDIILCFKLKDAIKYARTELGAVAYYSGTVIGPSICMTTLPDGTEVSYYYGDLNKVTYTFEKEMEGMETLASGT